MGPAQEWAGGGGPVPGLVGVIADYDAAQLEGYADGDMTVGWQDASGNENHLPFGSGEYRAAEIGGQPAVYVNGGEIKGPLAATQPATYILVVRVDSSLSNFICLAYGETGEMAVYSSQGNLRAAAGAYDNWTSSAPLASPVLLSVRFDGASTLARLNGAETALPNVGTGDLTYLYLIRNGSNAGAWTGAYGRVIIAGPQTDEQLNEAEASLAATYGITLA